MVIFLKIKQFFKINYKKHYRIHYNFTINFLNVIIKSYSNVDTHFLVFTILNSFIRNDEQKTLERFMYRRF